MSSLFNIDFKKLATWWLPTFLRTLVLKAYCFVLISPIEKMYIYFLKRRKQHNIKMDFNYQKFSLQKRLNDAFDRIERRIRIVNAIKYEGVYLYTEAEGIDKTKWLYGDEKPIYLRSEDELTSIYDFIVEIPDTGINQIRLRAEIDFYILQSKKYKIVII